MQGQKKRLADPGNILILTFYMEVKYTKEQIFLLFSLTKNPYLILCQKLDKANHLARGFLFLWLA